MLVNFQKFCVSKILDGSKIHTIRRNPKREPKVGEVLHMYCGLRTKNCFPITKQHSIVKIESIEITKFGVKLDGFHIEKTELPEFVRNDGFETIEDFYNFFGAEKIINGTPWRGILIHWTEKTYLDVSPTSRRQRQ